MATVEKEQFTFQAEIKQLLHLLAHSLYQSREIAIRELVSNASDALDKMRYMTLTDERYRDDSPLEITIEGRKADRQLVIRDNGIGMTHDELVRNLGTIAHSGSLEFLKNLSGDARRDLSLIGQFGVGFYSAFMIADHVRVRTRSYQEESGWEWQSDGTGTFTIEPAENLPRGTEIILHLKEDAQDFAEEWRIKEAIRKYSSFVPHPIKVGGQVANDQRPIWVEPKSQVTEEQYARFYQHLSHRGDEKPLWHLHLSVDSPIQFHAVLFCPPTNVERLGFARLDHGLSLCAKRVLVQSDNRDLLPEYLRFLYGLVDSEDLPLNVSRETLQDNTIIRKIRNTLVKAVFDRLDKLAEEQPETYLTFYRQFGPILKEGAVADFAQRDRIAKLLRFASSRSGAPEALTSLADYVKRMPPEQKRIYYLGGPDLASIQKSPNLEIFRRRDLEVLFLTDPIDEFVMSALQTFDGKRLTSIDSDDLELPDEVATPETKAEEPTSGFGRVLTLFREALGNRVKEVRASKRLTDSPCCLVNADGGLSTQMQRLLKLANKDFPETGRILEVNPAAPLIRRLASLSLNTDHDPFIKQCALQLWANALILEGSVPDPEEMVARVQALMEQAAEQKSPIVH
ncbi:MAG: molecular chaperone HtpG [Isosphaeraceae bacterium]|nr:molecular chaperone HtpG [Isosphaeraceae bacterium]